MASKCTSCGKEIGIYIEFGGAYWSVDSDPYCNKQCFQNQISSITKELEAPIYTLDHLFEKEKEEKP